MPTIKGIVEYIIPYFGNRRSLPYGKLLVSNGGQEKICPIMEDSDGQYVIFDRKRRYLRNAGSLYSPVFEFVC